MQTGVRFCQATKPHDAGDQYKWAQLVSFQEYTFTLKWAVDNCRVLNDVKQNCTSMV